MKEQAYVVWIYSFLLIVGGIIGFLKTGSWTSIIVSSIFTGLLARYALAMWQDMKVGYQVSLILLCILQAFFVYRYVMTQKMMPGGVMSILTILTICYLLLRKPKKV